jgi:hypothetical protein
MPAVLNHIADIIIASCVIREALAPYAPSPSMPIVCTAALAVGFPAAMPPQGAGKAAKTQTAK